MRSEREVLSEARRTAQAMRSEGATFAMIATALGVSRSSAYRYVNAPVESVPAPVGTPPSNGLDWEVIEADTVTLLQAQALRGSVPASRELVRMARDERTAEQVRTCANHVTRDELEQEIVRLWEIFLTQTRDTLPRVLSRRFELPLGDVQEICLFHVNAVHQTITVGAAA